MPNDVPKDVSKAPSIQAALPSVDELLRHPRVAGLIEEHGHPVVVAAARAVIGDLRTHLLKHGASRTEFESDRIVECIVAEVQSAAAASLRPVFNLTGVLIHTNLGRAGLPKEAIEAMSLAASSAVNLEFDLDSGRRGDRDRHVESLLIQLTGAEKATVVNNNAAAILLVLNTLGLRREVVLSRGELIEIGGEFRVPDIMKRAGCRLIEVGTTNRTHLRDYEQAITGRTALIMKVHPSNFEIRGFTKSVDEKTLAGLARQHGIPLVSDLGSGTLVDLRRWGLPYEPTPSKQIEAGVDLVTFSGDKLLGGPQAGIVVGRRDLVERINRNPLKRVLRLDKLRVAALEAVLRLYLNPDTLPERLPVLRHMTRPIADIENQAIRLLPHLEGALAGRATVSMVACESEVGSGSLPSQPLASHAAAILPAGGGRRSSGRANELARAFRMLPIPVIGRVKDGVFYLDLRCLDDEASFLSQLTQLGKKSNPRQSDDRQNS